MATPAPDATATAAASGAALPTTDEASRSDRPDSSSALVRRTTVTMAINPISVVPRTPMRQAVRPPMEVLATGPVSARNAGLAVTLNANASRSASAGYSETNAEKVDAATAAIPTTQTSSGIRSRRRVSLISDPVPV